MGRCFKNIIAVMIVGLMGLSVIGCGAGSCVVTLKPYDAEPYEATVDEMIDAYNENGSRFYDVYGICCPIEFTATVDHVSSAKKHDTVTYNDDDYFRLINEIYFKEGIKLTVDGTIHHEIVETLREGDKVHVESELQGVSEDQLLVWILMNDYNGNNLDETVIEIVK